MDALDFLRPRSGNDVYTGVYRRFKEEQGKVFEYETIDNPTRTFGQITTNLLTDTRSMRIKTTMAIDFEVEGFVTTQDGSLWQISQIMNDCHNSQALRIFKSSPVCEKVITLVGVDNPRGLKV